MRRWWARAPAETTPDLAMLGPVSADWLRQYRQQDRVMFHGVAWAWPVTATGQAGDRDGERPSSPAAGLHTGPA